MVFELEVFRFRLYSTKCSCPPGARPDLPSTDWKDQNCKAPERIHHSNSHLDEIIFEVAAPEVAWWVCTVFPPLIQVLAMHAENNCKKVVLQQKEDTRWITIHEIQ